MSTVFVKYRFYLTRICELNYFVYSLLAEVMPLIKDYQDKQVEIVVVQLNRPISTALVFPT